MNQSSPLISIVIPTHNRIASLRRTLDAVGRQSFPLNQLVVVVVADGCTDDTITMLRGYHAKFGLQVEEQAGRGAAAARNLGASCAKAPILLFLDDDVEPSVATVAAHVEAHKRYPGHVMVGPYPLSLDGRDYFRIHLCAWWASFFEAMRTPSHRFTFHDIVSGNLSIGADLFRRLGGFDSMFPGCGGEDYEFGIRLIQAGVPIAAVKEALAFHHDTSDLRRSLARKRQEGRTDVMIARKHPSLTAGLKLAQLGAVSPMRRLLRRSALNASGLGDVLASLLQMALELSERFGLRLYWIRLLRLLQHYWYYRGVADQVGDRQALVALVQAGESHLPQEKRMIELDLALGLKEVEARLDQERPAAALIRYGRHFIGTIPARPGAEVLQGRHLRALLADRHAVSLLEALILDGQVSASGSVDRSKVAQALSRTTTWFGPIRPSEMWYEQAAQWNRVDGDESSEHRPAQQHWDRYRALQRDMARLKAECKVWQQAVEDRELTLKRRALWTSACEQQKANVKRS